MLKISLLAVMLVFVVGTGVFSLLHLLKQQVTFQPALENLD